MPINILRINNEGPIYISYLPFMIRKLTIFYINDTLPDIKICRFFELQGIGVSSKALFSPWLYVSIRLQILTISRVTIPITFREANEDLCNRILILFLLNELISKTSTVLLAGNYCYYKGYYPGNIDMAHNIVR